MRLFFASLFFRHKTHLFRAVTRSEYDDILSCGRFRNPYGNECKYFAGTLQAAEAYARLATEVYLEGPYWILRATIAGNLIRGEMCVEVENRIQIIVIPTDLLSEVSPPRLVMKV